MENELTDSAKGLLANLAEDLVDAIEKLIEDVNESTDAIKNATTLALDDANQTYQEVAATIVQQVPAEGVSTRHLRIHLESLAAEEKRVDKRANASQGAERTRKVVLAAIGKHAPEREKLLKRVKEALAPPDPRSKQISSSVTDELPILADELEESTSE